MPTLTLNFPPKSLHVVIPILPQASISMLCSHAKTAWYRYTTVTAAMNSLCIGDGRVRTDAPIPDSPAQCTNRDTHLLPCPKINKCCTAYKWTLTNKTRSSPSEIHPCPHHSVQLHAGVFTVLLPEFSHQYKSPQNQTDCSVKGQEQARQKQNGEKVELTDIWAKTPVFSVLFLYCEQRMVKYLFSGSACTRPNSMCRWSQNSLVEHWYAWIRKRFPHQGIWKREATTKVWMPCRLIPQMQICRDAVGYCRQDLFKTFLCFLMCFFALKSQKMPNYTKT